MSLKYIYLFVVFLALEGFVAAQNVVEEIYFLEPYTNETTKDKAIYFKKVIEQEGRTLIQYGKIEENVLKEEQYISGTRNYDGRFFEIDEATGDTIFLAYYKNNIPVKEWIITDKAGERKVLEYDFQVDYHNSLKGGYTELPPEKQQKDTAKISTKVVERLPQYPGGEPAMRAFISENIYIPASVAEKNLKGTVWFQVIINEDGTISDLEVRRALHPVLDKEAARIIRSMPAFSPALSKGEPVKIYYTIPVIFRSDRDQ